MSHEEFEAAISAEAAARFAIQKQYDTEMHEMYPHHVLTLDTDIRSIKDYAEDYYNEMKKIVSDDLVDKNIFHDGDKIEIIAPDKIHVACPDGMFTWSDPDILQRASIFAITE